MNTLKKCLPDIAAVIFFILISVAYFFVPMTRGEVLYQGDNTAGAGLNKDVDDHYAKTGDVSHWTNTAFSGMPTYQMRSSYKSTNILNQFVQAYHLWLPQYVWYLFAYLIGFYILLRALRLPSDVGSVRLRGMGFLVLFLNNHRSRSLLESDGSGLSPADDCGYSAGLQG